MGAICCHPLSTNGKEKIDAATIKDVDMASELCEKTGFTVEELKKHFNDFMTDYPDGNVTVAQFAQVYMKFFPDAGIRGSKRRAEEVFRQYDQNNDGTIDFREFTIALSKLSQGTIRQKLSLAFYLYDENCDGVLTFDEVLGIVEAMYAGDQKILGRKKNDKLPPPNVFAKKLFEELDKNGDGQITEEEFVDVGQHNHTVADLLLANMNDSNDT